MMRQSAISEARERREGGAALLVAVMMLVLMGAIGLASLDTVTADRQIAGQRLRTNTAFQAAEAGVAAALGQLRSDVTAIRSGGLAFLNSYNPGFPDTELGDSNSFHYGRPGFGADPTAAQAITYLGRGDLCDWIVSIDENVIWQRTLWEIRVQGETADGTNSRIQAVGGICRPFNTSY